jgi:hypothetical protein
LHLRNSRNGIWLEEFADGDIDTAGRHFSKDSFNLVVELAWDPRPNSPHRQSTSAAV